jgi:hypothetical protein
MTIKLSSLVRRQLPEFISTHYSTFASFLEKYYESLEITGQPLDILSNIANYYDINFYEKNLLQKGTNLSSFVSVNDDEIELDDAIAFPEEYGYVKIDNEICFYTKKEGNTLTGVYRGISASTKLGDLYNKSEFVSSNSENHAVGTYVQNISNLFLFAILKSFEAQYLSSIPEKYLNEKIDKRTLIKNITDFYRSKGSEKSIQFIFNSLVSTDPSDKATIRRPSDLTLRSSDSNWITSYRIKIDVISGNPKNLIGKVLEQSDPYAYAVIESVDVSNKFTDLIIDPTSIVSEFKYYGYTELLSPISSLDQQNFKIEVVSTSAWKSADKSLYIGNEEFDIVEKNVNQFTIKSRSGTSSFSPGSIVYLQKPYEVNGVKFNITGSIYNLRPKTKNPYSVKGDPILQSKFAKSSIDPIVYDASSSSYRWIENQNRERPVIPTLSNLQNQLSSVNANVSAILDDETYFYICSSGYPSYPILADTMLSGNQSLSENNYLKLVRKSPIFSPEIYETNSYDVGIFVDGTLAYSKKSDSFVRTGPIVKTNLINKGFGYKNPPIVLVNGSASKAVAILSGNVVSEIKILTTQSYKKTPSIFITSGRNAALKAVVTNGKLTSIVIENPGEYYVSPPQIIVRDLNGRGKFAECEAVVSNSGKIIGVNIINQGKNYSSNSIVIDVIPQGRDAEAEVEIEKWYYNRYNEIQENNIDYNGGSLVNKKFESKKTYAIVSNPKRLRYSIGDNISSILAEQPTEHSKILGFAYDGYPIYGPYAYQNPLDSESSIVRMNSGYVLNNSRTNGPSIVTHPLGIFDKDYTWVPNLNSGKTFLDQNNGRYCVTPEYPNGTYAYFVTIDSGGEPEYPYIIGKNYYGIPVDSNYNQPITQNDIPSSAKLLDFSSYVNNGINFSALVSEVEKGSIDGFTIDDVNSLHNPGNLLFVNNDGTGGEGFVGSVESVLGENVSYINSKNSVSVLSANSNVYLFDGYNLQEQNTSRVGKIVGDVLFDNTIILEEISDTFDGEEKFDMRDPDTGEIIKILNIFLSKNSTFTANATVSLTDGFNRPDSVVAVGTILESASNQNVLKVLVESGDFSLGIENDALFLQSSVSSDDVGTGIVVLNSLSENIEILNFKYNFAIVKTENPHNLAIGDNVNVSINPDDSSTQKTFFVRKRLFQELKLRDRKIKAKLRDTGIGKFSILSSGTFRSSGTYTTTLGNASVQVVITNNTVSNITILDKGSDFVEDQQLRFDAVLVPDPLDASKQVFLTDFGVYMEKNSVFVCRVDHAGFGIGNTEMKLSIVENISNDDLLSIGKEIVKVLNVDYANKLVSVQRAQNGTIALEHFDGADVSFYDFSYRFNRDSFIPELGTNPTSSPKVYSYDRNSNVLVLYYQYGASLSSTIDISLSNFFKDESFERKDVLISSVGEKKFKLEFSEDNEDNFVVNPNINIQNYYKYIFKTGHPSMYQTYLDFSPSLKYNLITQEKIVGDADPGTNSPNSFVSLKFGFGPALETNTYTSKVLNRFSNYYYFIVASGVTTDNAKLSVVEDPLTGSKNVAYVTSNKFLYELNATPQENGSGEIFYSTSSQNALGLINSLKVNNSGKNYADIPVVIGVEPARSRKALLTAVMNLSGGVDSFIINDSGVGYINPKIILDGDGSQGIFQIALNQNGGVISVKILNGGLGYTKIPKVYVIEDSNKIYLTSKNIGIPKTIEITSSGNNFTTDTTTLPNFTSTYAVLLSDIGDASFSPGRIVNQYDNFNNLIFSGKVSKNGLKRGSNIVRFEQVFGDISKNYPLNGAKIIAILYTNYESEIRSFYDKSGYFGSEKGFTSSVNSNITDSYFYQDYSYVIRSKTPIEIWRSLIKDVVHPAGFQLFGEVVIEANTGIVGQTTQQTLTPIVLTINTGVQSAITINTRTQVTETILSVSDTNVQRGVGRLHFSEFYDDSNIAKEIYLSPNFDGYIDPDNNIQLGTKTFNILDTKSNQPVFPYDENSVIVSLSGVIQEPKVSYTIEGSTITFASAPLGERISEGQSLQSDPFIGRVFGYRTEEDNQKYFKKIKNIFQRSGIWLDAANQIHFNRNFIVEETFGYLNNKYPNLEFNTEKCKRDIGYIIDSFEHDLRFGGNLKTVTSGNFYFNAAEELQFINDELEETKDAYKYAAKLCAAAIRNWDVAFIDDPNTLDPEFEVIVSANSDVITVPSTFGIVEGMYVSSGSQFPSGTKVIEIMNDTNVRVSSNSFANITDEEVFVFDIPIGQVVLPPVGSTEVEFNYNGVIIQTDAELIVSDGITVSITAQIAKLRQVRFSLSRINTGKYVDASNLIYVNREYIIDETISYINLTYPGFSYPSEKKCRRDIGHLIDAVIYHLRYGGNNRLVDYAEKYYFANKLNYINEELTQTVVAFEYSIALMLDAIENPGSPFQTVNYVVASDDVNPLDLCIEVKSTINAYRDLYTFILENGPNLIERNFGEVQKSGNYTELLTFSNYNLIDDEELQLSTQINGVWFASECANVISSLYNLQQSLDQILTSGVDSVDISGPDYFNGETKQFELYTDSNAILKTDPDENLLIFINGVLQRTTSYKILRSENPQQTDIIEFTEAPRWDQNEAQLLLNQGTAVDYFYGFSIGNYQRRTIDKTYFKYESSYRIVSENGYSIDPIFDSRFHLVFVDGVLQRNKIDYNIDQTRIIFKEKLNYYTPATGENLLSNVDIISFSGEKNKDTFIGFDFQPGSYSLTATFDVYDDDNSQDNIYEIITQWNAPSRSYPIDIIDEYGPVGRVLNYVQVNSPYSGVRFTIITDVIREVIQESITLRKDLPYVNDITLSIAAPLIISGNFVVPGPGEYIVGAINVTSGSTVTVPEDTTLISISNITDVNYETNNDGEKILRRANAVHIHDDRRIANKNWRILNKLTANILEGDKIKVDGEEEYRDVLKLPDIVKTTQNNLYTPVSKKTYGNIITSVSDKKPKGSGLRINPILDSQGRIVSLDYGKDDYIRSKLLNLPSRKIGLYPKEIYVDFLSADGNGGGAFAKAFILNNEIISVEIVSSGFGYTSPPIPYVSRGYDIIKSHRNASSTFKKERNIIIPFTLSVDKQIEVIDPSLIFNAPSFLSVGLPEDILEYTTTLGFEVSTRTAGELTIIAIPQELVKTYPDYVVSFDPSVLVNETLWTLPSEYSVSIGASQSTNSEVTYTTEFSVSIGESLRFPENINQLATLVNIDFLDTDTVLYVTSTSGFDDFGYLQVGTEVVKYTDKQADRFFITERGVFGTSTPAIHPIGTFVSTFLPNINANSATFNYIEVDDIFDTPIHAGTEIYSIAQTNIAQNVDFVTADDTVINYYLQPEIYIQTNRFESELTINYISQIPITDLTILVENAEVSLFTSTESIEDVVILNASMSNFADTSVNITTQAFIEYTTANIDSYDQITNTIQSYEIFDVVDTTPAEFAILFNTESDQNLSIANVNRETQSQIVFNGNITLSNISDQLSLFFETPSSIEQLSANIIESDSEILQIFDQPVNSEINVSEIILGSVDVISQIIFTPFDIEINPGSSLNIVDREISEQLTNRSYEYGEILNEVEIISKLDINIEYGNIESIIDVINVVDNSSINEFTAVINVGNNLNIIQQEIRKQPEDLLPEYGNINDTVEITSILDINREYGNIESNMNITTRLDRAAIDEFNETINVGDIETN